MKKTLSIILAVILLLSAVAHIMSPGFYAPMIPSFIPVSLGNILATITEFTTAILLLIPKYRKWGGLSFMALMITFLPLHIWDMFRDVPIVGPQPLTTIRLVFQFAFIFAGWWIYKTSKVI
ncbi:DoxX family protein [Flammeovirga aprica]|uniref:DoxX family protein n=1 Tax=Flammeovirga aprica JL-4 TaxID=694437 RepID=A0A7X9RZ58_9BACT|nr:hypothetical protein [Flammeovirga aprica]NME71319.1 hypothetical protein [Flammeovirga aprica JL-4]